MKTISISKWVAANRKAESRKLKAEKSERGCVRSTSRSGHDISRCCGWSVGHSRAPFAFAALCALALLANSALAQVTNLNLGNLAPGETMTVTFDVTINNTLPANLRGITNQAAVSGTGITTVNSDDPDTGALNDPTVTPLVVNPSAVTLAATSIGVQIATLRGSVNPGGDNAGYYFEYATNIANELRTVTNVLAASFSTSAVSAAVSGLLPNTVYQYRLLATNSLGLVFGNYLSFTTAVFAITGQPTSVGACVGNSAVFAAAHNAGSGSFQWQRRDPGAAPGAFNDIAGATSSIYSTPPVTAADDGAAYRVIASLSGSSATSSVALLSVISIPTPTITYDFNSGLPANTAVYGNAFTSNGVLVLTTNGGGLLSGFLTADLAPGRVVRGFTASFKVRIYQGSANPADGFSFNWAPNVPNGVTDEEGSGSGLTVSFDTFNNFAGDGPAIDVKWNSNIVSHTLVPLNFISDFSGSFRTANVRLNSDGTIDIIYNCAPVVTRLAIPGFTPQVNARFLLGARTRGEFAAHSVDDFAIQLDVDPTNGVPRLTAISNQPPASVVIVGSGNPGQNVALLSATNVTTNFIWRANVAPNASGVFTFVENTTALPQRFYKLAGAAQFPSNLVNYWRAESNYLDSFGSLNGTPNNNAGFINGQRGLAFDFNGVNQSISLGGTPLPVPWTACFWVRRTNANDVSAALISDANTALKLEQAVSTRRVGYTQFGGTDFMFNTITPTNVWTHLGFVASAGGTILYVNGVAAETNANTVNLPRLTLGASFNGAGDRMKGQLDETAIFNRALTPAEIQQVLNATRGP